MNLQDEIESKRALIKTDAYPMSIGELANLYRDGEIDIHPEFQRFFRWTLEQKTRLIESLLLGIPIPPIFVAQRTDGVWDVVDGVQRLSTIFQFMGLLKDESGQTQSLLELEATKYLPSLRGMKWEDEDTAKAFTASQRLFIKRAKLDMSIVLRESDDISKYELFQRLNTGGTPLSDQEVRNCILVMVNPDMFRWLQALAKDANFVECVAITDRAMEERYDMELVLRFLVFRTISETSIRNIGDLGEFLTNRMVDMAQPNALNLAEEEAAFKKTFEILVREAEADAFRRYDTSKRQFVGGFLISAFEVVAIGVGHHHQEIAGAYPAMHITQKIQDLWENQEFIRQAISSGVRASSRIPKTIPIGRRLFQP